MRTVNYSSNTMVCDVISNAYDKKSAQPQSCPEEFDLAEWNRMVVVGMALLPDA
jgi:hypothetical protein